MPDTRPPSDNKLPSTMPSQLGDREASAQSYLRVTLVRHGQTNWHAGPEGEAVADPPLTPLGHRQAARTAQRLASEHTGDVDRLIVSPLRRARETVAPIADALELEPVTCDWLAELHVPLAGMRPAEVLRFYSGARRRPPAEWHRGIGKAERFADFHSRVTRGFDALLESLGATVQEVDGHPVWQLSPGVRHHLLVVCHGGTSGVLTTHLLGVPPVPWEWERFSMSLASMTRLHTVPLFAGAIWSLDWFSDTHHLAGLQDDTPTDDPAAITRTLDFEGER